MTFDSGTWWLVAAIAAALIAAVTFFVKRLVERVDNCVTKPDHEKDLKECKDEIKHIKEDFLTKEDFFREQSKTDRKLDRIMDILLEMKGGKPND